MLPHTALVDRDTALNILMQLPKPVSCVAIDLYGQVGVGCWPQPVAKSRLTSDQWMARVRERREVTRERLVRTYHSTRVLVIGKAESLDITLDQLWAWEDRYHMPFVNVIIDENDQRARAQGVAATVTFSPPQRARLTLDAAGSGARSTSEAASRGSG